MNKNQVNSFYEFIKQKSQEKGRPLKIIADWDECLFAFRPTAIHRVGDIKKPFKEFFEEFWEKASLVGAKKSFIYEATGEEKIAYDKFVKLNNERRKDHNKNAEKYKKMNFVDDTPFLSIAEDIFKCLKEEGVVDRLITITTTKNWTKGQPSMVVESKKKQFARTFSKFSQCQFEAIQVEEIDGETRPFRGEWTEKNYPDFDIFIDDDVEYIRSVKEKFPVGKIYVMPDYKYSRAIQGDNIYHVKQKVSDLKDEDFAKAAEKYQNQKNTTGTEQKDYQAWIINGILVGIVLASGLFLFSVAWMVNNKKINKKNE